MRVEGPAWLGPSTRLYAPEAQTVGVMFACLHCGVGVRGEWCDPHGVVDALVWWG